MADPSCTITYQYSGAQVVGYCVDCPEIQAVVAQPEKTIVDPQIGWNSGARSVLQLSGDCYTEYQLPSPLVGVVCGLAQDFTSTQPSAVPFGFYVKAKDGKQYASVIENGKSMTADTAVTLPNAVFRVERRAAKVRYYLNNKLVYTSTKTFGGALCVVALLYHAADGVQ